MSKNPNRVNLRNGGYLLFDKQEGQFRVAVYLRKTSKSSDLNTALSNALGKSAFSPEVTQIAAYIESVKNPESLTLD